MAPRILPDTPLKHERVALIGVRTPLGPKPEPNRPSRFDDRINPRWLRIPAAVKYSGISRSRLFRLIREGEIQSASLQESPSSTRGVRLIDRLSLDLLLERLCLPAEERLVKEVNILAEEQNALAKKQDEIEQQLAAVRRRRRGGDL